MLIENYYRPLLIAINALLFSFIVCDSNIPKNQQQRKMDSKLMIVCSVFLFAGFVCAAPTPKADVVAPVVAAAPAFVTATSSQVIARNYNGLAAPLVAAPAVAPAVPAVAPVAPVAAPYVAAPYAAYPAYAAAPYFAYY